MTTDATITETTLVSANDLYGAIGLAGINADMTKIKLTDQDGFPCRKAELERTTENGVDTLTLVIHFWE